MKKAANMIFGLMMVLSTLATHAASYSDVSNLKIGSPVAGTSIIIEGPPGDSEGTCDCTCVAGTYQCNDAACGMQGSGCGTGDATGAQLLDPRAKSNGATLKGLDLRKPVSQPSPSRLPSRSFQRH